MNILFLTRRFFPSVGGVETHVLEISKRLVAMGHTVTVIAEELNVARNTVTHKSTHSGIEVLRIKGGANDWFKKFRIWEQMWSLRKIIKNADIVHCHDVFFWYFPLRLLYPGKHVYTTFHGYETIFPVDKKAIIVRKISEKLSSGNICIGDYISKWYGTKPDYVTYGGVEIFNSQFSISDEEINSKMRITLIGRMDKDIGVNTYLKAIDALKKKGIRFSFKAYGAGKLTKKVGKYGRLAGFSNDPIKVMEGSDIIFCSSYLLILQALVLKKVVVAVYENPLKEDYLRKSPFANYIFICKDANEVSRVVTSVEKDAWKYNSMIEKGYDFAKEQTWDRVTNTYRMLWKI